VSAQFDADFFDGRTSRRYPVRADVDGGRIAIRGESVAMDYPREVLKVHPRIGATPVRIDLPEGGLLVARDFDAVDEALDVPRSLTLAHRLESYWPFVVVALAGLVVAGWFLYDKGIPWGARAVAKRLPPGMEVDLGRQTLAAFDRFVFHPTAVDAGRRARIEANFERLKAAAELPQDAHLEFRNAPLVDANALTLPGGNVVVTDQLVDILDDDQVNAVLAHELGHVYYRHGTQLVLANSVHALMVMAIFGDANAVAGAAALAPTAFLNAGYSRGFEREADDYAFRLLARAGGSPSDFAGALQLLESHFTKRQRPMGNYGYLSTHPDSQERIKAAEAAAASNPPRIPKQ